MRSRSSASTRRCARSSSTSLPASPAATRLREAGLNVVTIDRAPGMKPDVVGRAEEIPFADASFDVVACRVAAHHFQDPAAALREMARVSRSLVLLADNLFLGEAGEEADRLRDPTHVRNYSEQEWRATVDEARRDGARFG